MKVRNYVITSNDQADLVRLNDEYQMIGRETELTDGKLVVLALPRPKPKDKKRKRK
jgi:hypothetical protein